MSFIGIDKIKTHVFLIIAKTNLHVGDKSGVACFVIDKVIQRDPLTKLPYINSCSLKGAIKEFCAHNAPKLDILKLFSSEVDKETGELKDDSQKGEAFIFNAKLLMMPRQDDENLFHYITCNEVINQMNEIIDQFDNHLHYDIPLTYNNREVKIVSAEDFHSSCSDDNLPIIARNMLENGELRNLWYEQVIPAETVFYAIIREEGDELKNALNGQIVQIGANATIGYGYCEFKILK